MFTIEYLSFPLLIVLSYNLPKIPHSVCIISYNSGIISMLVPSTRYVIECPNCAVIYRSRQYWYGNQDPVDTVVRTEIQHIWPGVRRPHPDYLKSLQSLNWKRLCLWKGKGEHSSLPILKVCYGDVCSKIAYFLALESFFFLTILLKVQINNTALDILTKS